MPSVAVFAKAKWCKQTKCPLLMQKHNAASLYNGVQVTKEGLKH